MFVKFLVNLGMIMKIFEGWAPCLKRPFCNHTPSAEKTDAVQAASNYDLTAPPLDVRPPDAVFVPKTTEDCILF